MGLSTQYPEDQYPAWTPGQYQGGARVRHRNNIFVAGFWTDKEPGTEIVEDANPQYNSWQLYDELYDETHTTTTLNSKIIAYLPTWRSKDFDFANEEIYQNITHGIISFLMFKEDELGEFTEESLTEVKEILPIVLGHKNEAKICIALGGATDYGFLYLMDKIGNNLSDPLLDATVDKVVNFVNENNLDGVDLDLECWWDRDGDPSKDQGGKYTHTIFIPPTDPDALLKPHKAGVGLTEFAKRLRAKLSPIGKTVSAAVFATSWYGNNYDPTLVDYLDWLGVMSYDLTGAENKSPVGPHTALFKIRNQEIYGREQQLTPWDSFNNPILSVEDSLWYWSNNSFLNSYGFGQKLEREKLAFGVPTYGYDFAYKKDPDPQSGQIPPGYKVLQYKQILEQFPDAGADINPFANYVQSGSTDKPDFITPPGKYPFAHNIYYETPGTAVRKLKFLKFVGVQGVIIWDITGDAWGGSKSIIKALYQAKDLDVDESVVIP